MSRQPNGGTRPEVGAQDESIDETAHEDIFNRAG